jgi:hypothetical protein
MYVPKHQTYYMLYLYIYSITIYSMLYIVTLSYVTQIYKRRSWAADSHAVLLRSRMKACFHRAECKTSEILVHIGRNIPPKRNVAFSINSSTIISCYICRLYTPFTTITSTNCWNQYGVQFVTSMSRSIRSKTRVDETFVIYGSG